jgi:uncharacterized protein DUF11
MGFLDNLKKRMSTPGAERYSEERFKAARPHITSQEPSTQTSDTTPPVLVDVEAEARRRHRRTLFATSILVAVLVLAGLTAWGVGVYREARTVREKHIALEVTVPESIQSGADVTYQLALRNDSRIVWENVVVEAKLPDGLSVKQSSPPPASTTGTVRWAVGTMRPRESVALQLLGRLVGEQGTSSQLSATVALTPHNAPGAHLEKSQFASVRIDAVPIDLAVEAPRQAASGEKVTVRIAYQNQTTTDLTGVRIAFTPPPGFVVEATDPNVEGRDIQWDFATIPQLAQGAVTVVGFVEGDPDAIRPFQAAIGFMGADGKFLVQRQVQATTKIARRALTIVQVFNGKMDTLTANPGEEISANVTAKNSGTIGLRDVIVKLQFEGKGLNARSVDTEGGFFDSAANTITWTAASIPGLKALLPEQTADLEFKFHLLPPNALPFEKPDDKNFSLVSVVTADSPDVPAPTGATKAISSDRFELLVNSVLSIERAAFYDDGRAGLPPSTGPKQPTVGKETTYSVRVRIGNTSNDVVDSAFRTIIPEGLRWLDKKYTTVGDVTYNERTREVQWKIPAIAARAGALLPGPELAFQVGVTPSLNQLGKNVALTKALSLSGTDVFTAARLTAEAPALTTEDVDPKASEVLR